MFRNFAQATCTLTLFAIVSGVHAQPQSGRVVFQNGVTLLPGGGFYEGTEDTEFRSASLTDPPGFLEEEEISVDGNDNGNQTQGAIRFTELVESGLLPAGIADGTVPIRRAFLTLYKTSPSDDGLIEFHRIVGTDLFKGLTQPTVDPRWEETDAWGEMEFNITPGPDGRLMAYPFSGEFRDDDGDGFDEFHGIVVPNVPPGVNPGGAREVAEDRDFADSNSSEVRRLISDEIPASPVSEQVEITYGAGFDSEDILNDLQDFYDANDYELDLDLAYAAYQASFFNYDVTDAVTDWLTDPQSNPNLGWVINNNSDDGWDMFTSEAEGLDDGESFLDGETAVRGAPVDITGDWTEDANDDEEEELNLRDPEFLKPLTTANYPELARDYPGFAIGFDTFDTDGDEEDDTGSLLLDQLHTRPQLTIIFGLAGDLDFDNDVDEVDFGIFLEAYGKDISESISLTEVADLDFDRDVDAADFVQFKQSYLEYQQANAATFDSFASGGFSALHNASLLAGGTTSVPEPNAGLLAFLLFAGLAQSYRSVRGRQSAAT